MLEHHQRPDVEDHQSVNTPVPLPTVDNVVRLLLNIWKLIMTFEDPDESILGNTFPNRDYFLVFTVYGYICQVL